MSKISQYIAHLFRLRGIDLADVSIFNGATWDTRKISGELLENVLAEYIGLDCQTVAEVTMTLVVNSGVSMEPVGIAIKSTASLKGSQDIVLQIGSFSGGNDILPPTRLMGFYQDAGFSIALEGVLTPMFSDTAVFYLQVITPSSGSNVVNIRVLGNQFDV